MDTVHDFEDLLEIFGKFEVRYLIIGGLAFIYHAKPRYTKDLDLWVDPEPVNVGRTNEALVLCLRHGLPRARDHFVRCQGATRQAYWEYVDESRRRQRAKGAEILVSHVGDTALAAFGSPHLLDAREIDEILQLGVAPNRIDLLRNPEGPTFDEAWRRRVDGT